MFEFVIGSQILDRHELPEFEQLSGAVQKELSGRRRLDGTTLRLDIRERLRGVHFPGCQPDVKVETGPLPRLTDQVQRAVQPA